MYSRTRGRVQASHWERSRLGAEVSSGPLFASAVGRRSRTVLQVAYVALMKDSAYRSGRPPDWLKKNADAPGGEAGGRGRLGALRLAAAREFFCPKYPATALGRGLVFGWPPIRPPCDGGRYPYRSVQANVRRFFAAIATSREGHRPPRSDPAVQHRRWGRVRQS
jgi:hypothetical protein